MTAAYDAIRDRRARALQGTRAGLASRLVADGIDWVVVVVIYTAALLGLELARVLVTGDEFSMPTPHLAITAGAEWAILVLYLAIGWAGSGRTFGKSVMGLRVVRADGRALRPRQAFVRSVVCASVGIPLLFWVLLSRRNKALYDVFLRTQVVYDWATRV